MQVDWFLQRQDESVLQMIFDRHKEKRMGYILKEKLQAALQDLHVVTDADSIDELFESIDVDRNGKMDFQEFKAGVNRPSKLEQWTTAKPFGQLLAAALTPIAARGEHEDPVRAITGISQGEIREVCQAMQKGICILLENRVRLLQQAFISMDSMQLSTSGTSKFSFGQVVEMSCGEIGDFYAGLGGRVGVCLNPFQSPTQLHAFQICRVVSL